MTDGVAIFDQNLKQVLSTAAPAKATVRPTSKLPEHPLENGSVINDHKIFNPIEIDLLLFLSRAEYKTIYAQIKQLYYAATLLTVQTAVDSFKNLTIQDMPHEETADMYDAYFVALTLKEIRFAPAQYGVLPASSVQQPSDSSTQDRGEQQPQSQSVLSSIEDFFKK